MGRLLLRQIGIPLPIALLIRLLRGL